MAFGDFILFYFEENIS